MANTLKVVEDPDTGDLLLELTDELCEELGWTVGDQLKWKDLGNGKWSIKKVSDENLS